MVEGLMVESWMVTLLIAISGAIGTYAVLRSRVARSEKDFERHADKYSTDKKDIERSINASFKKIDICIERIIKLEQDTSNHIDLVKAEEKFVSKKELELHLKNIELNIVNIRSKVDDTNSKVDSIEGKLVELLNLLTECRIENHKKGA